MGEITIKIDDSLLKKAFRYVSHFGIAQAIAPLIADQVIEQAALEVRETWGSGSACEAILHSLTIKVERA